MEIRSKLWFEIDSEPVFGRGRSFLLQAIDRCGSISQAAKEINISYRRAWSYIKTMEERLCLKLVERQSGGKNGGGAVLTGNARKLLKQFEQMEEGVKELIDHRFKGIFGGNGGSEETACRSKMKTVPVETAVGMVLAHDITEIRKGAKDGFKGRAFRKGHVIKRKDIAHLRRLGKDHLFVLSVSDSEIHEDDAACAIAAALMGEGVSIQDAPKEGKISIVASRDGLLKINKTALARFNMHNDVMCATLHDNAIVERGQIVAGTRAIPLVLRRDRLNAALAVAEHTTPIIRVMEIRRPSAGVIITGNEVYYGRVKDGFASVIRKKIASFNGKIVGMHYAPDDKRFISGKLKELVRAGADLLILSGGMSVDPDDVTRFAVRDLGADGVEYGAPVLPGSMFQIAYIHKTIPVLGIPACAMYHKTTVLDLILPRVLAGESIGRKEIAELGHGGLCLNCKVCRYPACPFGK
ncbi:MAG: LysR family transcriptional regulator [Nitrospirae bacterium]|nr:LysR family transcriptional regulator [Nitrospirota bacterium]